MLRNNTHLDLGRQVVCPQLSPALRRLSQVIYPFWTHLARRHEFLSISSGSGRSGVTRAILVDFIIYCAITNCHFGADTQLFHRIGLFDLLGGREHMLDEK
jgi:hypothetical protein